MQSLLLPDADVIIVFHRLGYWEKVVSMCKVYVASTVVSEVQFYRDDDGNQIPIDFAPLISDGKITVLQGDLQAQSKLLQHLIRYGLDGLDAGELESITIISEDLVPDLKFCLKERLATKVMACLNKSCQAISIEEALRSSGILGKREQIDRRYSDGRVKAVLLEGAFQQVEIDG